MMSPAQGEAATSGLGAWGGQVGAFGGMGLWVLELLDFFQVSPGL